MLIFVPPSETKAFPAEAPPVELCALVLPELAPARARLLKALVRLARGRALLESGQEPAKPDEFADVVRALGYTVEPGPAARGQHAPTALDIVVREL